MVKHDDSSTPCLLLAGNVGKSKQFAVFSHKSSLETATALPSFTI